MAIPPFSRSSPSSPLLEQPLYPIRRASEFDVGRPPRYSSLLGTLPPSNPIAPAPNNDGIISPSSGPPAYSSIVQQRSRSVGPSDARSSTSSTSLHIQRSRNAFLTSTHSRLGDEVNKHEYCIMNEKKAKPWATLEVYSASSSRMNTPQYAEGAIIRGIFQLDLDTPRNIESISLSLRGSINTRSYDNGSYTFLDQQITSWDRNCGDPRSVFFISETTIKKFEGKLYGQYRWPFFLTFPKNITIRGQHQYLSKTYTTPRSFLERGTDSSIQYELVVRMTHGLLRADSKLNVEVSYVPDIITPDPVSSLCKAAYRENAALPGPYEDPEGWFSLHANIHGKLLLNDRHAHLRCTLSLTKPQCYPRGGVIPCHLSIHSTNTEVLEKLAKHRSIRVCLIRRIQYYEDPKEAYSRTQNANNELITPGVIEEVETIERAVWWPGISENPNTRDLEGEIHLNKDLEPSSQFLLFKVSHTVELYPFEYADFKCTNSGFSNTDTTMQKPKAFITHPVTITTQHRQGQVLSPVTKLKPQFQEGIYFPAPEFSFRAIQDTNSGYSGMIKPDTDFDPNNI